MARANRTGVPGLTLIKSGPRAGRYSLGFRYLCPVERRSKRLTKLYPAELKTAAIKADARALVNDALTGALAKREAAAKADETKVTIASIAAEVVRLRELDERSQGTLAEFRSVVVGDPEYKGKRPGGHVVRHLGAYAPHELDSAKLAAFVDALRDGGASPRTIRNIVKVLGQFLRIVRVRKLDPQLTSNPIRDAAEDGLRLPTKRREPPKRLDLAVASRLVTDERIPHERRARYAVGFLSGLRDGEIAGLTWADVELDAPGGEVLHVTKAYALRGGMQPTKTTAAVRDVPIHPELARLLRLWRAGWSAFIGRDHKPDDPVFPQAPPLKSEAAKAKHHRPSSAKLLRRDLRTLGETVTAEDFHATRRTLASALEAAKVPHELIERILGHEPKSVLGQHYAAPDLGVLREAISRLRLTDGGRLRVVA